MRPVLRPGLRLVRDPAGQAALVDRGVLYRLDGDVAVLLDKLDGLLSEQALLHEAGENPAATAAWARLRASCVVVDVEAAARLVRGLDESARPQALTEATALVAHEPATADESWRRRREAVVEVLGSGAATRALVSLLESIGIGAVRSRRGPTEPDVTLLGHDHDPPTDLVEHLMREGRPHLVVGLRGIDGVVGPFVRPGESACLRCADLARCAVDPGWGRVREQLSVVDPATRGSTSPASALVTTAVGALAAAEVLAHVEGRDPSTLDATASITLHDPIPAVRPMYTHPSCGCTWDTQFALRRQWSA